MPQISKTQFFSVLALVSLSGVAVAFAFSSIASDSQSAVEEDPVGQYFFQHTREDYVTYTDPVYGFSFPYPADFTVSNFFDDDEGERYVALLENPRVNLAIQIVVSPTDQNVPITIQDLDPSVVVEHPVDITLTDGTPALRFYSKDADGKDIGEIWFIRDGDLYQITMHAGSWFDAWPQELGTKLTFGSI
jgi:hypothetical protein